MFVLGAHWRSVYACLRICIFVACFRLFVAFVSASVSYVDLRFDARIYIVCCMLLYCRLVVRSRIVCQFTLSFCIVCALTFLAHAVVASFANLFANLHVFVSHCYSVCEFRFLSHPVTLFVNLPFLTHAVYFCRILWNHLFVNLHFFFVISLFAHTFTFFPHVVALFASILCHATGTQYGYCGCRNMRYAVCYEYSWV